MGGEKRTKAGRVGQRSLLSAYALFAFAPRERELDAYVCLRVAVRVTRPTTTGRINAKIPPLPHCFSPILLSTTNALSYIERRRIPLRQESSIRTRGDKSGRRTAKSNVEIYPTLGRENEKKGGAISPFLE